MADYPTLTTDSQGSGAKLRDPKEVSLSRANTVKARLSSTTPKFNFLLVHRLSKAEYDTFMAFYLANRALIFTFHFTRMVADEVVTTDHTCIFSADLIDLPSSADGAQRVQVGLWEV